MVEVSGEDVQFLKDEYVIARTEQRWALRDKDELEGNMYHGMARGLEIALIKLGVSNDELDELALKAKQESQE